ncbi:CopG family transcriptional regulator [Halobellus sp. GM3]|uniref:CopG family transcriptional regulator n=1 Tax=Halobellus sp. GM3 TaxID=3458410 RepID=UPI00403D5AC9
MGTERVDGLPDELESWVAERAAADDLTREEIVRRLIAAHRLLEEDPDYLESVDPAANGDSKTGSDTEAPEPASATEVEALTAELREAADRIAALETDLDEKITDVRERVIQVKRETDAKAPADHDHPALEDRMAAGFENYEEILEYLTETADDHDAKLDTVAGAVVDLRARVAALERESTERAAVSALHREANRQGVATAACESCGQSVRISLLDEPFCPHCESPVDGVEPKRGFFGSDRLTVGNWPALEGPEAETDAPDGVGESLENLGEAFAEDGDGRDRPEADFVFGNEEVTEE